MPAKGAGLPRPAQNEGLLPVAGATRDVHGRPATRHGLRARRPHSFRFENAPFDFENTLLRDDDPMNPMKISLALSLSFHFVTGYPRIANMHFSTIHFGT